MEFIRKYSDYRLINESISQAKSYLSKNNIDPNNEEFVKIRELLKKFAGFVYLFTYFHFEENIKLEDLKILLDKIKDLKPLLGNLPRKIVEYDKVEVGDSSRYEILFDDLQELEKRRDVKYIYNLLPSTQKELVTEEGDYKKIFLNLSVSMKELGKDLIKQWISKISRYKDYNKIINYMERFIKENGDKNFSEIIKDIESENTLISYKNEEENVIITILNDYESCKKLASSTQWCIVDSKGTWDSYTSGNIQYMLYDLNRPLHDTKRIIGVTYNINKKEVDSIHEKDDTGMKKKDLEKWFDNLNLNISDYIPPKDRNLIRKAILGGKSDNFGGPTSNGMEKATILFKWGFYEDVYDIISNILNGLKKYDDVPKGAKIDSITYHSMKKLIRRFLSTDNKVKEKTNTLIQDTLKTDNPFLKCYLYTILEDWKNVMSNLGEIHKSYTLKDGSGVKFIGFEREKLTNEGKRKSIFPGYSSTFELILMELPINLYKKAYKIFPNLPFSDENTIKRGIISSDNLYNIISKDIIKNKDIRIALILKNIYKNKEYIEVLYKLFTPENLDEYKKVLQRKWNDSITRVISLIFIYLKLEDAKKFLEETEIHKKLSNTVRKTAYKKLIDRLHDHNISGSESKDIKEVAKNILFTKITPSMYYDIYFKKESGTRTPNITDDNIREYIELLKSKKNIDLYKLFTHPIIIKNKNAISILFKEGMMSDENIKILLTYLLNSTKIKSTFGFNKEYMKNTIESIYVNSGDKNKWESFILNTLDEFDKKGGITPLYTYYTDDHVMGKRKGSMSYFLKRNDIIEFKKLVNSI